MCAFHKVLKQHLIKIIYVVKIEPSRIFMRFFLVVLVCSGGVSLVAKEFGVIFSALLYGC